MKQLKDLVNQYGNISKSDITDLTDVVHITCSKIIDKVIEKGIERYPVVDGFYKKSGRYLPKFDGVAIDRNFYQLVSSDNKDSRKDYSEYSIDCTGDACVDDEVVFEQAIFTGTYPNTKFSHTEVVVGKIIKDSYGKTSQQHTFTLLLENGEKMLIKGRNLYRNKTFRKPWSDESARKVVLDEKHSRGDVARQIRRNTRLGFGEVC